MPPAGPPDPAILRLLLGEGTGSSLSHALVWAISHKCGGLGAFPPWKTWPASCGPFSLASGPASLVVLEARVGGPKYLFSALFNHLVRAQQKAPGLATRTKSFLRRRTYSLMNDRASSSSAFSCFSSSARSFVCLCAPAVRRLRRNQERTLRHMMFQCSVRLDAEHCGHQCPVEH